MKVVIVDDEAPARARMEVLVRRLDGHEVVAAVASGREALAACERDQPEAVLLDIRMPGMDGLETAARLAQRPAPPAVIFVTAYGDHALEAFDLAAIDYLVKPVREERLATALAKASRLSRGQLDALQTPRPDGAREHILCRRRAGVELIPVDTVRYFVADQKYVTVSHVDGEDLIEDSLKKLEDEFAERFVRIHRKALVAVDSLAGLAKAPDGRTYAVLTGSDERLEVSRRHVPYIRGLLRQIGTA